MCLTICLLVLSIVWWLMSLFLFLTYKAWKIFVLLTFVGYPDS